MNVVKILGGIGNQLFQYSFGKVLRLQGKTVAFDTTWYGDRVRDLRIKFPRPFRLDKFNVEDLTIQSFIPRNPTIHEDGMGFDPSIFNLEGYHNFDGYWQYLGYYKDIIPLLQKEFTVKTTEYTEEYLQFAEQIKNTESVSVHVRRGDYRNHRKGAFRDLPASYYFSAIKRTQGDLFIFSDDLPWCRAIFKPEYFSRKIMFVDIDDYLAFDLMRLCKHNVVTNSTFSWWAALLNANPDKTIVCPDSYLGGSAEHSAKYRYPEEWTKIGNYAVHNV